MADVLPWFPFYHLDWTTSQSVLMMAPPERDAYVILLCLQWRWESLPFDCIDLWPLLPGNVERNAAARILASHFPPDPDTNRRRNPKLTALRERAIRLAEMNAEKGARGGRPPKAAVKPRLNPRLNEVDVESQSHTTSTTSPQTLPLETALEPYLRSARYPHAVRAGVAMLLNPEASPHYPEAVVCQALTEMQGAGKPFKQSTLAHWCQNLAQGPLPPRGRTNGPRGARFSYLTAPDPQEGA